MVNDLLKYGIETLSWNYDITFVDCEAGPEQVNRRVVRSLDTLIIFTDTSIRGIHTAEVIKKIVQDYVGSKQTKMGLVINRVKESREKITRAASQTGLTILGCVPEDANIAEFDFTGKLIIELPLN